MAVTANLSSGTLSILGDLFNNQIAVVNDGMGNILVNSGTVAIQGGPSTTLNTTAIQISGSGGDDVISAGVGLAIVSLTIDGGAGNDTITGGDAFDLLIGGDDNDIVTGGRGNDTALLGNGDDTFVWNPGDGSDTVEGQAGFDTLNFNASNASEMISISANGSRVSLFRDVGNVTMDLMASRKSLYAPWGEQTRLRSTTSAAPPSSRLRWICKRSAAGVTAWPIR